MLIEFSIANYLSIRERQTLRLDASTITEHKEQLIDTGRYKLLRSAVIYGANASGKSNLLLALSAMREIVTTSAARSSTAPIGVIPFLLSTETENSPSIFEVLFLFNDIRYRYGFEADTKAIKAEWLFESKKGKEKSLFMRVDDAINVHKDFKEGKGLEEKTRNNALFLGVCDQFNGVISKQILKWFNALGTISGVDHKHLLVDTLTILNDEQYNAQLLTFLGKLDLGFKQIEIRDDDIFVVHAKYNATQVAVSQEFFNLDIYESAGTQKLFDIIGQIFYSLLFGGIQVVDELDSKLHPLMTQAIIRLFNDPETNPNNAQLIFATHDTNLLTYGGFRRDQIYFTEKDQVGATCLYSLVEYKEEDGEKVRNDQSFEKAYIKGRYGAIPFIGDLSKFIPIWQEK